VKEGQVECAWRTSQAQAPQTKVSIEKGSGPQQSQDNEGAQLLVPCEAVTKQNRMIAVNACWSAFMRSVCLCFAWPCRKCCFHAATPTPPSVDQLLRPCWPPIRHAYCTSYSCCLAQHNLAASFPTWPFSVLARLEPDSDKITTAHAYASNCRVNSQASLLTAANQSPAILATGARTRSFIAFGVKIKERNIINNTC
jgi:hypothetical protein